MTNQPRAVYDAFRESMLSKSDEWMSLIAEDVSLIGPLAQVNGKDGFIAINKPFFESIRGSDLLTVVETGNYIITQIATAVAMPTGKVLTLHVCEWYEIHENKIQSLKTYFDTAELLSNLTE